MWWKWTVFIFCALLLLSVIFSTSLDWLKRRSGSFGARAEDWWGCVVGIIILGVILFFIGRSVLGR